MAEQALRTVMRTTDVIVTATLLPTAVVAIGLADLYARFPLRIGLGLGAGATALSGQDAGSGASAERDARLVRRPSHGTLDFLPGFSYVAGPRSATARGARTLEFSSVTCG